MFAMRRTGVALVGLCAVLAGGAASFGQVGPGGGGGGGGGFGGGGMPNFDPTAIREMLMQRFQQQLEATDDEWKVIEPKFLKVMQLQLDAGEGTFGMLRGLGRGPGGPGGAQMNQMIQMFFGETEPSKVSRLEDELQQAIDNNMAPEKLKEKLENLRAAKAEAQVALAKAQAELVSYLSLRQEAMLVEMGILE
ncbi:MAG TPA: hypothetical protein VH253_02360 [Phycisphaerae bacterium]|nr:hypothetical protein [Phycisphaerae bacterium]